MKKLTKISIIVWVITLTVACTQRNKDVVEPLSLDDLPQVIILDDEGDGDVEDSDEVGIKLTLLERVDPSGENIAGTIIPLKQDVTLSFEITDPEGFTTLSDYILEGEAFYEIDDCTTSDDEGEDLDFNYDASTGKGSVTFPAGVEEIEIAFTLDETLFDDGIFNTDDRGFIFKITGTTGGKDVVANTDQEFEYDVLDDEGIFGEWVLDHNDATAFANFKTLFGLVDEDIATLNAVDVDEIIVEFKYDELSVLVVLTETESVTECGDTEIENKEIELEMDYDELTDDALTGEASFEGEIENDNESIEEYEYSGEFTITGSTLSLTLEGEYDDEATPETTLTLTK